MSARVATYPTASLREGLVTVRGWTWADLAFLTRASSRETDPWSPMPCAWSEHDWITKLDETDETDELIFILEFGEPRRTAGVLSLGAFDRRHRVAEIVGCWVHPALRGHGIAPSAFGLVSRWAFESLGYERVHIFTRPDNEGMRRAAARAGWVLEGVLRSFVEMAGQRSDAVVLSMIPSDGSH